MSQKQPKISPLEMKALILFKKSQLTSGMVREHKFYRFRFDFAWPAKKVAVEMQSWEWHHTKYQLERDRYKLNIAISNGWRLFQFSTFLLRKNPSLIVDILRKALA